METQTQISAKIRDVTAWQDDYYDLFTKFLTAKNSHLAAAEKKLWEMRTKALADLLSATAGIAEANPAVLTAAKEVIKTIKNLKTEMKKASDEYKAASKKITDAQAAIDEKFITIKNVNYQQRNFCNYSKNEVKKYSEAEQENGTNEVDLCASW
jgi:seryl-tRNA synthetase